MSFFTELFRSTSDSLSSSQQRSLSIGLLCFLVGSSCLLAGGSASRVNEVLVELKQPKNGSAVERFELTEEDINDWTRVAIEGRRRLGVEKVEVDFQGANRMRTTALVNMDEVELTGYSIRLFKAILSGVQRLEAEGKIQIEGRKGVYEVESARFNGIAVPAWVVNAVLSYLSKNQPPHVDITEPFNLPFGVEDIRITGNSVIITR